MKSRRDGIIIDPTPEKKYLRAKSIRLNVPITDGASINLLSLDNSSQWRNIFGKSAGWTKSLDNLPALSNTEIDTFIENSTKSVTKNYTHIKKLRTRGLKFFEEKHIDCDTLFSKQNDLYFLLKGKCSASKKQVEYNHSLLLLKSTKEIIF